MLKLVIRLRNSFLVKANEHKLEIMLFFDFVHHVAQILYLALNTPERASSRFTLTFSREN